jgi:DNA-binding NarL/FixJ family response regulator
LSYLSVLSETRYEKSKGIHMAKAIRVVIADDYFYLRAHMVALLGAYDGIEVVGAAHNGQQAIELCAKFQPDVVLMDARMPEIDGYTATRAIRQQFPNIQVIIITIGFNGEDKTAAEAGASAFLLKPVSSQRLVEVIRTVHVLPDQKQ